MEILSGLVGSVSEVAKHVTAGIKEKILRKYSVIDMSMVPDRVNYAKVEKYLRSVNVEVTRRMFITYLDEELLPQMHVVKNSNYSLYAREQIIYYILIDMFKPILSLAKVKILFTEVLNPLILEIGLDDTFRMLAEVIVFMTGKFEDAVASAMGETILPLKTKEGNLSKNALYSIAHYTNILSLCMVRGALDFYKFSPFALLE